MNLTIVGLGRIGTSLGLALKGASKEIAIIGHDPDSDNVRRAKKLGAIDKSHWNLVSACDKADFVVLDVSLEEMETTLQALSNSLETDTLIIDTAPVKQPVMDLAGRLLPALAQFVGGHVVPCPSASAGIEPDPQILQDATFYLVPSENVSSRSLDKAASFVEAVGAKPQFIDAIEHDGLVASTLGLPVIVALAMMNAIGREGGWRDRIQCIGTELANVGSPLLTTSPEIAKAILTQVDGMLPWLDTFAAELASLRGLIAQKQQEELETMLDEALETLARGLSHRMQDQEQPALAESPRSMWRDMFLGRFGQRRSR